MIKNDPIMVFYKFILFVKKFALINNVKLKLIVSLSVLSFSMNSYAESSINTGKKINSNAFDVKLTANQLHPITTSESPGITWDSRTTPSDNQWVSVAYGNNMFVAVAISGVGNRVMTSSDGTTWVSRSGIPDRNWYSITYGNGMFVAVAEDGLPNPVITSPDGINWTQRSAASNNFWLSVTYGNGLFVATSYNGSNDQVMTSPDGITWTSQSTPANNQWYSVTYGNGLFVAVANSGTGNRVMTSPDGISWTSQSTAVDNNWRSVTYGEGLFVAVATSGSGDRVMTSPDGINWTIRTTPVDNSWNSVTYGNGTFVAVANSGTDNQVMLSDDGVNWTTVNAVATNNWQSVCYGNGLFCAVSTNGSNNKVMTSGTFGVELSEIDINSNLEAYYPFNGNANDASGNGFDAVANASVVQTVDRHGTANSAFHFDSNSQISIEHNGVGSVLSSTPFTVSLWIKPENLNAIEGFFTAPRSFHQHIYPDIIAWRQFQNGIEQQFDISVSFNANQWNQFVWTYDGSKMNWFLNGDFRHEFQVSGNLDTPDPYIYHIGASVQSGVPGFDGDLDDIRIYSRALTAAEIDSLYKLESTPPPSAQELRNLEVYLAFDGNLNDQSVNSRNATSPSELFTADRTGTADKAYSFNNANGITVPGNLTFAEISFGGWIRLTQNITQHSWVFDTYGAAGIYMDPNNVLGYALEIGTGNYVRFTIDTLKTNIWYHVGASFGADTLRYYLNGVKVEEQILAGGTLNYDGSGGFYLGKNWSGGFEFIGEMDEFRLYSRVLSPQEFLDRYDAEKPPTPPIDLTSNLEAYYPFNGNTDDASGNERNLINVTASDDVDRFGNSSAALSFEYGQVAEPEFSETGRWSEFTISLWAKANGMISKDDMPIGFFDENGTAFEFVYFWQGHLYGNFGTSIYQQNNALVEGEWAHYLISYEGTNIKLFTNGELKTEYSVSNQGIHKNIVLGRGISVYKYSGSLDDIRIYSRALTAAEVDSLYKLESNSTDTRTFVSVWPGDTNQDKLVNGADLLPIARFYGETATQSNEGLGWKATGRLAWETDGETPARVHADADGNGTIEAADLMALYANYGKSVGTPDENAKQRLIQDTLLVTMNLDEQEQSTSIQLKSDEQNTLIIKGLTVSFEHPELSKWEKNPQLKQVAVGFNRSMSLVSPNSNNSGFDATVGTGNTVSEVIQGLLAEISVPKGDYSGMMIRKAFALTATNQLVPVKINREEISLSTDSEENRPTEFFVSQNFPNPFNPTTTIQFGLPEISDVTIQVIDIQGRVVKTNTIQGKQAGIHSLMINMETGFSSGVYFYRLEAKGANGTHSVITKKMILIK